MSIELFSGRALRTAVASAAASALLIAGASTLETHHAGAKATTINAQAVGKDVPTNDAKGPISLTLSDSPSASAAAYMNVINRIRQRVTDGRTHTFRDANGREHTLARGTLVDGVVAETPSNTNDYFMVHLQERRGTPQISLVMNAANLYVVGFYNHEDGDYYRMGEGPAAPIRGAQVNTDWLPSGHYSNLTRTANQQRGLATFDRGTQAIGLQDLRAAISTLRDDASSQAEDARAITMIITAFAEAARFDYISNGIRHAIGNNARWHLGETGVAFTNTWDSLSGFLRSRLQDAQAFVYHVGRTIHMRSIAEIASFVAVCYMAANWQYRAPK